MLRSVRPGITAATLLLSTLVLQTATRAQEGAKEKEMAPVAVPNETAQAQAKQVIQELFKNEYASRRPDERAALAKKLLQQGLETTNAPDSKYVLLCEARDIAASLGDADTALKATDEIIKGYLVDQLEERLSALTTLIRTVATPQAAETVLNTTVPLMNTSISENRFDLARRFVAIASAIAKKSRNAELIKFIAGRTRQVDQLEREYAKVKTFVDFLVIVPDDPDANLAVGLFTCLTKGDFEQGLPFLAKGSDEALRTAAKKDLAGPTDADAQVQLGDLWEAAAEKEEGSAKENLSKRAALWYAQTLPNLTGLTRTLVEAKLKKIQPTEATNDLAKQFTDAAWYVTWVDGASGSVSFQPDGTCSTLLGRGLWTLQGDTAVVIYPDNPICVQQYQVVGGAIYGKHYEPRGRLRSTGQGVARNRRRS